VGRDKDWAGAAAGGSHAVAIKNDGSLWAWGGVGNDSTAGTWRRWAGNSPVRVDNDSDWASVAAGGGYALALKKDGSLWAWGNNAFGQLGLGDTANQDAPVRVGTDSDWLFAAAGASHAIAIKRDGSLWAWGNNANGQLGLGDAKNRNAPARVGRDNDWVYAAAGLHTLAVKADGSRWAWGKNLFGQLADGTTDGRAFPVRVGDGARVPAK
jgi:alpha-tubulin suppressor-like RCC1 family protein